MSVTKTAEAVCIGHPDKLCDLIADTILDDILYEDPAARVAVEVMASGHRVIVTGEITSKVRPRIRESVRYDAAGSPVAVETVVVSIQHDAAKDLDELAAEVKTLIVAPARKPYLPISANTEILINPSDMFTVGGPKADTGLTGRKLMVDTYGGLGPRGGGAFGKDPSKVDRTGAYLARLIARTIVDARLATECQMAISYAIGKADPVAFQIDTLGTGEYSDQILTKAAAEVFPLRPGGIIDALNLRKPGFTRYSTYGHFGHTGLHWENSFAHVDALKKAITRHEG